MSQNLRVKICGITRFDQATAIAELGADALGFMCVPQSPRYLAPGLIAPIATQVQSQFPTVSCIGVFADASLAQILETAHLGTLSAVQLHGTESPEFCQSVREALPQVELIKAIRVRSSETLSTIAAYQAIVDTMLLDAYSPHALGGTGLAWDWRMLQGINLPMPWFLAGGLTPENVSAAIAAVNPPGIDLSSGVERAPGDKDLTRVQQLFAALRPLPQQIA